MAVIYKKTRPYFTGTNEQASAKYQKLQNSPKYRVELDKKGKGKGPKPKDPVTEPTDPIDPDDLEHEPTNPIGPPPQWKDPIEPAVDPTTPNE